MGLRAVAGAVLSGGPSKRSGPPSERTISAPYVAAFEQGDKRMMRKAMRAKLPDRREAIARNGVVFSRSPSGLSEHLELQF